MCVCMRWGGAGGLRAEAGEECGRERQEREGEEGRSGAGPGELQTAVTQHALTQQGLQEGLLLGSRGQHTHTHTLTSL